MCNIKKSFVPDLKTWPGGQNVISLYRYFDHYCISSSHTVEWFEQNLLQTFLMCGVMQHQNNFGRWPLGQGQVNIQESAMVGSGLLSSFALLCVCVCVYVKACACVCFLLIAPFIWSLVLPTTNDIITENTLLCLYLLKINYMKTVINAAFCHFYFSC